MRCRRTGLMSEVEKYEQNKGLEDGFELWSDVVTKGWIVTDSLIKIQREDGTIACPFLMGKRGRTFIAVDDYIITDEDGTRFVCGADKVWNRYERLE